MLLHHYEVVVIGAGHAGLAASYQLKQSGISHVVLEKGKAGETWRSLRWNSFALNTPNDLNILPGDICHGIPDAFSQAPDLINQFNQYIEKFNLPVVEDAHVTSVTKPDENTTFEIRIDHAEKETIITTDQVIVCSGSQNIPVQSAMASQIDPSIFQIHGGHFKNTDQLPPGNVLVVGSGQTGVQIAEDLIDKGRKVFLSTSKVGRLPRRFRGREIMYWILEAKMFDVTPDMITDPAIFELRTPQVSGTGRYGHTVSLQSLCQKGVVILGKLVSAENTVLHIAPNAKEHIQHGDTTSAQTKAALEQYISSHNITALASEPDPADAPDVDCSSASDITSLDLKTENITSIVWCNGFTGDYSYLKLPVLNEKGMPIHKNGISPYPGVYFLGIYWLRSRKSGIIHGITEDSEFIISQIRKSVRT